jgi:hypothetical protein
MKIFWVLLLILIVLPGSFYIGTRFEAFRIQQTCEDQHAWTVVNGVHYACFTMEELQNIQRRLKQHGA